MLLLAVGDLHGETDTLLRLLDDRRPDGLLCVGDWGDPGQIAPETWVSILDRAPALTVYGNHDDLPTLAALRNRDGSSILLAQGERRPFCGLAIAGVSGIWAKSHRLPHYITDEDVAQYAALAADPSPLDILLTHGCPLGIADRTPSGRPGGQRCFLDLLQTVRPRLYLCGHLHLAQTRTLTDPPCTVFNTGALPHGGHYIEITTDAANRIAQSRRLSLAPTSSP